MFASLPTVTRTLLIVNVVMFVLDEMTNRALTMYLALWPLGTMSMTGGAASFQPWQVITYSFLHGNLTHIFLNMFALYMFGGELERLFGQKRYFNLYFISVISAALMQLAFAEVAGGDPYPTVGASGGVFGLLGGWLVDKFGRKTIMAASIFLYSAAPFCAAFMQGASSQCWHMVGTKATSTMGAAPRSLRSILIQRCPCLGISAA